MPYKDPRKKKQAAERYRRSHLPKKAEDSRRYYQANRAKILARRTQLRTVNKAKHVEQHRKHTHGLFPERFAEIWTAQNGRCANPGCGADLTESIQIDHDHRCCPGPKSCGGCIRGLLCRPCNVTLGNAQDDRDRLLGLVEYLDNYELAPKQQLRLLP